MSSAWIKEVMDVRPFFLNGTITKMAFQWFLEWTRDEREAAASMSLEDKIQLLQKKRFDLPIELPITPEVVDASGKFRLVKHLGNLTVPNTYNHATCLAWFREKYTLNLRGLSCRFTDAHYPRPCWVLRPGDRLGVQVWEQVVDQTILLERLEFLRARDGILVGPQGIALTYHVFRDQLPKGCQYVSIDEGHGSGSHGEYPVTECRVYLDGTYGISIFNYSDMGEFTSSERILLFTNTE